MIRVRLIEDLIDKRNVFPPQEVGWTGESIAKLAPSNASVVVFNETMIRKGGVGWNDVPPDGSYLCFIVTYKDPVTISAAIAMTLASTSFWVGVAYVVGSALVGFAVNLALNKMFAPSAAGLGPKSNNKGSESAVYAFDTIRNSGGNNSPRSVCFGEARVGGTILSQYRMGGPNFTTDLYTLIALSEGQIERIGDDTLSYSTDQNNLKGSQIPGGILINGQEANTLDECSVSLRMGTNDQAVIPTFQHQTSIDDSFNFELIRSLEDEGAFVYTTQHKPNEVSVNLFFPNGMYEVSKTGKLQNKSSVVNMTVYELDGATPVETTGNVTIKAKSTQGLTYTLTVPDLQVDGSAKRNFIIKAWRVNKAASKTATDKKDTMMVVSVLESLYINPVYQNTALLGIKLRANEQISGATPTITAMIRGKKVVTEETSGYPDAPDTTDLYWSNNPSHIARDLIVSKKYGLGAKYSHSDIDSDSFSEWAEYADELIPAFTGASEAEINVIDFTGLTGGNTITIGVSGSNHTITQGTHWTAATSNAATASSICSALSAIDGVTATVNDYTVRVRMTYTDGLDKEHITSLSTNALETKLSVSITAEKRHAINIVLDSPEEGLATVKRIGALSRARVYQTGTLVKVGLERTKAASQLFCMGNLGDSKYKFSYVGNTNRSNVIEGSFLNVDANFSQDTYAAYRDNIADDSSVILKSSEQFYGLTSLSAVARLCHYHLRCANGSTKTCEFIAPLEAVTVEPTDVILVAHDSSKMAPSGRVVDLDSSGNVVLNRPVTFEAGTVYTYVEQNPSDGTNGEHRFTMPAGETDTLTFKPLKEEWLLSVLSYADLSGKTITLTINGSNTILTQGVDFSGASNSLMAASIASVIDALTGIFALAVGSTVKVWSQAAYTISLATNANVLHLTVDEFTPSVGRVYAIDPVEKYMVDSIEVMEEGMKRKLSCIKYEDYIYSDAASDLGTDSFLPEALANPNIPTDLAAVESSTKAGISTFSITWEAGSGPTPSTAYRLWYRLGTATAWLGGEALAEEAGTIDVELPYGARVRFLVQPVAVTGKRLAFASCPTLLCPITREDGGTGLLSSGLPGDVTDVTWTQVSGNKYTLSWTAPTTGPTNRKYEVRIGNWQGGKTIYSGTSTRCTVYVGPVSRKYSIRTSFFSKPATYYSSGNIYTMSPTETYSTYTTELMSKDFAFTNETPNFGAAANDAANSVLNSEGTYLNARPYLFFSQPSPVIVQAETNTPLVFTTMTYDVGSSAATHVCVNVQALPHLLWGASEFSLWSSMKHCTWVGFTNETYIAWSLYLEHSTDDETYTRVGLHDALNSNTVVTAQYFRFRFEGKGIPLLRHDELFHTSSDEDEDFTPQPVVQAQAMLEKLGFSLYRA